MTFLSGLTEMIFVLGAEIHNEASFAHNGYLELSRSLLAHDVDNVAEVIAFELSTNESDGLVFWHGQTPNEHGLGQDYISLAGKVKNVFNKAFL